MLAALLHALGAETKAVNSSQRCQLSFESIGKNPKGNSSSVAGMAGPA